LAVDFEIKSFSVDKCPICDQHHDFLIKEEQKTPVLGIRALAGPVTDTKLTFICPITHRAFQKIVPCSPPYEAVGVFDPNNKGSEYDDWVKNSVSNGTDYGKTMITISAGAVAVYFSVLQYLNLKTMSGTTLGGSNSIFPPILFLLAVVVFAFALIPHFNYVTEKEFGEIRNRRIKCLFWAIFIGTVIFVVAVFFSIWAFFSVLGWI